MNKAGTMASPAPIYLVGSYNEDGKANVMTAAWGGVAASVPPSMMVSLRKGRWSLDNILRDEAFTLGLVDVDFIEETDYFGMVSGKKEDKLAKLGLDAHKAPNVNAPFLKECPYVMECKLTHTLEVGSHMMLVGEVVNIISNNGKSADEIDLAEDKILLYNQAKNTYDITGQEVGKAFEAGKVHLDK